MGTDPVNLESTWDSSSDAIVMDSVDLRKSVVSAVSPFKMTTAYISRRWWPVDCGHWWRWVHWWHRRRARDLLVRSVEWSRHRRCTFECDLATGHDQRSEHRLWTWWREHDKKCLRLDWWMNFCLTIDTAMVHYFHLRIVRWDSDSFESIDFRGSVANRSSLSKSKVDGESLSLLCHTTNEQLKIILNRIQTILAKASIFAGHSIISIVQRQTTDREEMNSSARVKNVTWGYCWGRAADCLDRWGDTRSLLAREHRRCGKRTSPLNSEERFATDLTGWQSGVFLRRRGKA